MKILFASILLFFTPLLVNGQMTIMEDREDSLLVLLNTLRASQNDQEKAKNNAVFREFLKETLANPKSLTHPFSKLTTVGFIDSPDNLVRIVNWNVEQDNQTNQYFGFVLHNDPRRKKYYVTELIEDRFGLVEPTEVVTADKWYGALYYKIIPVKKGSRTVYTVLGWDGHNTLSNYKLIDAMYVTGKTVKFGSPIFKIGKVTKKRLFYEHAQKTTMYLNYEANRKRIMMDHLSPESPSMKGYKSFYVPDLSYDAMKFEGGKWILHEDVIGNNDNHEQKKQTVYVKNEKTGLVEKKEIDAKWINPHEGDLPGGSIEHVAVTPEDANNDKTNGKSKKSDSPKVNKKDKRDPNALSTTINGQKRKKRRRRRR
ncbi:MAG: hypothetical protein MK066_13230 [Crocinitomicaceae bacterium]|nr:hypothetical protein [Crocinitomicaceae bacterium]